MNSAKRSNTSNFFIFTFLLTCLFFTFLTCIALGSVKIEFKEIIDVIFRGVENADHYKIIYDIRLPRVLATVVGGAALAVSGLLLQIFFKNPIVEPYVLGVSSGATLAVGMMVLGGYTLGFKTVNSMSIFTAAFIGSLLVMIIVILFASKVSNITTLLVIGMMTGYACSGVTSFLKTFADKEKLQNFVMWTMGTFSGFTWQKVKILLIIGIIGLVLTVLLVKPLNAFLLGEEYAKSIGINIKVFRISIVFISSVLAAAVAAFAGPIGFIGLAVPQISRVIFKTSDNTILLPATMILGCIVTSLCDLISRTILSPMELPISTITSIFGAPIVIILLLKRKGKA